VLSRNTVADATGYKLDGRHSIPIRDRIFFSSCPVAQTMIKRPEREADVLPPYELAPLVKSARDVIRTEYVTVLRHKENFYHILIQRSLRLRTLE
jgi:hypothetical protein